MTGKGDQPFTLSAPLVCKSVRSCTHLNAVASAGHVSAKTHMYVHTCMYTYIVCHDILTKAYLLQQSQSSADQPTFVHASWSSYHMSNKVHGLLGCVACWAARAVWQAVYIQK